jgi:mRNA interferase RelE/StbE
MAVYRPDIPPHVAEIIRHLPPDLKRSIKQSIRRLSLNPYDGAPLLRELAGLRKYKVRRFRIVYEMDLRTRTLRIFAVGHRREVYEDLVEQLRKKVRQRR